MKSARFVSNETEAEFNENGFVHIPSFLDSHELIALNNLFSSVYNFNGGSQGMWNSLFNLNKDIASATSLEILDILSKKLSSTFSNFKAPVASFMTKNPNLNGVTELHRDFSILDENDFQYRNVWIPLVDTNIDNGALYALKGSHTFFDYPLPMFTQWPYSQFQDVLYKSSDIIPASAGDLVVYADRTLHGSFINQTKVPRPVVHFGLLSQEASIAYYQMEKSNNTVNIFEVPFTFFLGGNFDNVKDRYTVKRSFAFEPPKLTLDAITKQWPL